MSILTHIQAKPSTVILRKVLEYRERELEEHLPRDKYTYYVTDLVRCSMKREFEINHPKLLYMRITQGRTFLGETVHKGFEQILKEIFGDAVKIETEGIEKSKEIVIDGVRYVVKGRIDAILNGDTGVEIKETVSHGPLPYPHHVEQCLIYNWLYGFKKTLLFYISPDGLYEFEITGSVSDDEIIRRIKEPRTPRYDWECSICEFKSICPIAKLTQNNQNNRQKK